MSGEAQAGETCSPAPAEDDLREHEWTFCYRFLIGGQVYGRWLDHNGVERAYGKLPQSPAPGGIYRLPAADDGSSAYMARARYTGRRHPLTPEWRLHDEATMTAVAEVRAVKKLAGKDAVTEDLSSLTLAEVRDVLLYRSDRSTRAALIGVVLREIGAAR